ncbi:MAG: hypothetical protein WA902_04890 [Thermosynechococcaceae cyanobacterium]
MPYNIRLLDRLSYDEAEPLLEDYITDTMNLFLASKVGDAHVLTYPRGGYWIGTFIEFAYLYGEMTLPKMTRGDVQAMMEDILPRKITLQEPSEADDAVSELVAFWTFLKQEYKFKSAGAIIRYLQSIENKFSGWMFDPARGGIAKGFLMQAMQEGYDLTSQDELTAFQAEYNQRIKANPQDALPTVPMVAPPDDLQVMFDLLGVQLPAAGQPVNPMALMGQLLNSVGQIESLAATDSLPVIDELQAPDTDFFTEMRRLSMGDAEPLCDDAIALLKTQTITETGPGTILQDFQTALDFIGAEGVAISGKRQHLPLKLLSELNQRLSNPIEIDLKRPQQKSFPPIHGLYLLLRATGIVNVSAQGKQQQLVLNPEIYASWQQLNATERYCTLLEAWLVRGYPEMLGEDRAGPFSEGDRCIQSWSKLSEKKHLSFAKYTAQDFLSYSPGFYNLALMEMFGLLKITPGKPTAGKGWRIKKVEALSLGKALMPLVKQAYIANGCTWATDTDPTASFNELQPSLAPYFPEWKQTLAVLSVSFRPGRHIFKVSLGKAWRRIAVSGEATLDILSSLILDSVDFDHDHLDQFTYKNAMGREVTIMHPYAEEDLSTDEVKIGSLPLSEGSRMEYVFDFGDWWTFEVQLEVVEPEPKRSVSKSKKSKGSKARQPLGEILETHGEAPPQYPDYDDDW